MGLIEWFWVVSNKTIKQWKSLWNLSQNNLLKGIKWTFRERILLTIHILNMYWKHFHKISNDNRIKLFHLKMWARSHSILYFNLSKVLISSKVLFFCLGWWYIYDLSWQSYFKIIFCVIWVQGWRKTCTKNYNLLIQ